MEETFYMLARFLPEGALSADEADADNVLDGTYKSGPPIPNLEPLPTLLPKCLASIPRLM